jgi:hypothetical protein
MAVQFDCPYCTATMRVPDAAMGTIGRCPKCETSLRVPVVEVSAAAQTFPGLAAPLAQSPSWADETTELPRVVPVPAKSGFPFADERDAPRSGGTPPRGGSALFPIDEEEPVRPAAPLDSATAMRMRRASPRSRGWLWISMTFLVAAAGIGATFWWQKMSNPVYAAQGEALAETTLSSVVAQKEVEIPDADWAAIQKSLQQAPADLRSPQMNVTFEHSPRGIKIGLTPGRNSELVSVPYRDIPELVEASSSTNLALREPRRKALSESLAQMSAQIQAATAAGRPVDLSAFGNSVGVAGLGGPLGFACHAVIDRSAYPCVFEDRDGKLYFLVPAGSTDFVIRPREAGNAAEVLPPRLQVQVTVSRTSVETKAKQNPDTGDETRSDAESARNRTGSSTDDESGSADEEP